MLTFVILAMFIIVCIPNILVYVITTKIERKEFYDYDLGEMGLRVKVLYPTATLWQTVTLVIDFLFTWSVLKGFYWDLVFGLIMTIIIALFCFVIWFFYHGYSETKLEQKQGYLSIINLATLASGLIIAGVNA